MFPSSNPIPQRCTHTRTRMHRCTDAGTRGPAIHTRGPATGDSAIQPYGDTAIQPYSDTAIQPYSHTAIQRYSTYIRAGGALAAQHVQNKARSHSCSHTYMNKLFVPDRGPADWPSPSRPRRQVRGPAGLRGRLHDDLPRGPAGPPLRVSVRLRGAPPARTSPASEAAGLTRHHASPARPGLSQHLWAHEHRPCST